MNRKRITRLFAALLCCGILVIAAVISAQAAPPTGNETELTVCLDGEDILENSSVVYNGQAHTVTVKNGEDAFTSGITVQYGLPSGGTSTTPYRNAGEYRAVVTLQQTQSAEGEFAYTLPGYDLDMAETISMEYPLRIAQRELTVTAEGTSGSEWFPYTGDAYRPYYIDGVAEGDEPVGSLLVASYYMYQAENSGDYVPLEAGALPREAGSYQVTYLLDQSNPNYANYTLEGGNLAFFRITPAPLTIREPSDDYIRHTYDGKVFEPTDRIEGMLGGDRVQDIVTVSYSCEQLKDGKYSYEPLSGLPRDVGIYQANYTVTNFNYAFPESSAVEFVIEPIQLLFSGMSGKEVTYSGNKTYGVTLPDSSTLTGILAEDRSGVELVAEYAEKNSDSEYTAARITEPGVYEVEVFLTGARAAQYVLNDEYDTFTVFLPEDISVSLKPGKLYALDGNSAWTVSGDAEGMQYAAGTHFYAPSAKAYTFTRAK